MTTFSKRFGYSSNDDHETILEDAPSWLRLAYDNHVLTKFISFGRYGTDEPIGPGKINQDICIMFRLDTNNVDDSSYLYDFIWGCEWYEFYDVVELIGRHIRAAENECPEWRRNEYIQKFGYEVYRSRLNQLFSDENVAWRMNEEGSLVREIPTALDDRIVATQQMLADKFEPAREHYQKAVRYLKLRPLDPENSIKEMVSALESIGRIRYPSAKTLGDAVKEMRKVQVLPQHLITVIEKLYAYASAEPAVRHGAPVSSRVELVDAEFCLHVGTAIIRYLKAYSDQK